MSKLSPKAEAGDMRLNDADARIFLRGSVKAILTF